MSKPKAVWYFLNKRATKPVYSIVDI